MLVAAAAGLGSPGGVDVQPLEEDITGEAPNCTIEFFQIETLQRPYDKLAELRAHGSNSEVVVPEEAFRQQACALGADAVVGLHRASSGDGYSFVGATVRYR